MTTESKKLDWKKTGKVLWKALTGNLFLKLISLLAAVVLWAGLISQDPTLTREKTFTDVNINVSGADTLKRNGFIMTSDLSDSLTATMTVEVPQTQYQNVTAANYNPRIDLSRIRNSGTVRIPVTTSSSNTYGSVNSISPSEIELEVEAYQTRYRIPVTIRTEGEAPVGFWCTAPTSDPQQVVVSGPRSLVQRVSRAVATLSLSDLPASEGSVDLAVPFVLYDTKGDAVESDLIEVTSESVLLDSLIVSLTMYPVKEISLSSIGITEGEPADGYEATGLSVMPESVTVAAPSEILGTLDSLYVTSAVSLNGRTGAFQGEVRIRRPSGTAYLSAETATVTVDIQPIFMERTFRDLRLNYANLPAGLNAALDAKTVNITVGGPQNALANVRQTQLNAVLDLSGCTEPGTYQIPVEVTLQDDRGTFTLTAEPAAVSVTLSSK